MRLEKEPNPLKEMRKCGVYICPWLEGTSNDLPDIIWGLFSNPGYDRVIPIQHFEYWTCHVNEEVHVQSGDRHGIS